MTSLTARALCNLAVLSALLAACGAKTGLEAPDSEAPADASMDAASDVTPICIDPPEPDAAVPPVVIDLSLQARVATADVLFVIDRTGSMDQEIDNIRQSLRTIIVPGLVSAIGDLNLGLVTYADFPVEPYGSPGDDRPFSLERPMGRDFTALQGALTGVTAGGGGDNPEAMIEALYQVATGAGLRNASGGFAIEPAAGCRVPGVGYACIRPRAVPIIVLIADAPSHNGPAVGDTGSAPYSRASFPGASAPHSYSETITALTTQLGARVIGINSGVAPFWGREHLVQIARDTNSIGQDGQPLVFDINSDGTGLSERVVSAVERFTNEVRLDVSGRAVDVDGSGSAALVLAVRPRSASPATNVQRIDGSTFFGVIPGTQLFFDVEFDRARVAPRATEQRLHFRIEFLDRGRPILGFRDVEVVIPAVGSMRCPTL